MWQRLAVALLAGATGTCLIALVDGKWMNGGAICMTVALVCELVLPRK